MELGTGIAITFDSGFFAEIVSVNHTGLSRAAINSSHMGTTVAHTFTAAKLFDPGQLEVELHFDPDTRPPIDDAAATATVTFPGGDTWAASAFMTDFEYTGPFEDKMTARGTLKYSGNITVTPGP